MEFGEERKKESKLIGGRKHEGKKTKKKRRCGLKKGREKEKYEKRMDTWKDEWKKEIWKIREAGIQKQEKLLNLWKEELGDGRREKDSGFEESQESW